MSEQLKTFLSGLLYGLVELRKFGHNGGHRIAYALGQITAAERLGVLTFDQAKRFRDLLISAGQYASRPFPCDENSGPCMPIDVWWGRHKAALAAKARLTKLPAQDSANEKSEPVPAPTSRRELRLLCVLRKSQLGVAPSITSLGYLPVHTMHRLPPRSVVTGKWAGNLPLSGLYLRQAQARFPSREVLARCERHRQANAVRPLREPFEQGELI